MDFNLQNESNQGLPESGQKEREMKETPQLALWKGAFGNEYPKRDANALPEMELSRLRRNWGQMLGRAVSPAPGSALEVGANIGRNLVALDGLIRWRQLSQTELAASKCDPIPCLAGLRCIKAVRLPCHMTSHPLIWYLPAGY